MKTIKMKPLVAQFKMKIIKLYLFLKVKNQVKAYQQSCRCMLFT